MVNSRTKTSREVGEDVRKHYPKNPLRSTILENVTITNSTMAGSPVVKYRKNASASRSNMAFAWKSGR